ncbi:MAG TPA: hypothetical protein VNO70_07275 [Blastocatellia bacterium]|nr:hypothetical protein [Blastocatellia bacterium]
MSQQPPHGISREGLDATFEAEEARKSNLLLAAQLLRDQKQEEAAAKFAQAAAIEERLSDICAAKGLTEKAALHRFSAASCWAQAGNFYRAIELCDDLLARADLPDRLRQSVQHYGDTLRLRRAQWYAELELETMGSRG